MSFPTRRRFLGQAASAAGALAARPLRVLGDPDPSPSGADMSVARLASTSAAAGSEGSAARLTRAAIGGLGGMSRFVRRGDVVWVKPNMGWNRAPELAANTHPDIVAELVRLCYEAGAKKVKVGDNTCHAATQCYQTSGVAAAAVAAGAVVIQLEEARFRETAIGGERLTNWPVYSEILEADLVINVPIAKHHGMSIVTLGMKNYMGVVGGRRNLWHQDLPTCLCDIVAFMRPRLSVLDATRILTAHGPQGGNTADVKRLDTILASTDIIALDAFGAELLGRRPEEIATVRAGFERGLGEIDYRNRRVLREVTVT
jgi:uncharacterized protein (DUF362 family)